MITAGGKNVSPSRIETALKSSPYISEASVVGEGRKYLTALIELDVGTVSEWARANDVAYTSYRSLATNRAVYADRTRGRARQRAARPGRAGQGVPHSRPRARPRGRGRGGDGHAQDQALAAAEHFAHLIDEMYSDDEERRIARQLALNKREETMIAENETDLRYRATCRAVAASGPTRGQSAYKIGISGAATGPASPSYLPHIEGFRTYLRPAQRQGRHQRQQDRRHRARRQGGAERGGIERQAPDGRRAGAGGRADEPVVDLRADVPGGDAHQDAGAAARPGGLSGQCGTPQMNPFVFCGGSTSDPNTAGYWQVPLVKALADKNKDELKLALVADDIPISRQGIDNMEKLAGKHRRRGRRQAGDPAGGGRCQRRGVAHHRQAARTT